MNSLEARFILEACRAGDLEESDPKIAEALRAMESDPELARWFTATQEIDRAVVAKLKAVPVPEDLLARIRAGGSTATTEPRQWSRRRWLAIAAGAAALALPAAFLFTRATPGELATFRNDMAEFMDRGWDYTFDLDELDFTKVKQWLAAHPDSIQVEVPAALASSPTIGCRKLKWRGNRTTLICFSPRVTGTTVHILIVDRSAVTDAPSEVPQLAKLPNWESAAWSRGDKVYLALTKADSDKLTGCL